MVAIVAPKPRLELQRLDGALWDAYAVPAVTISVSGSVAHSLDALHELGLSGLEPGDRLIMSVMVTVAQMTTGRNTKDEATGTLKLRLDRIRVAEEAQ